VREWVRQTDRQRRARTHTHTHTQHTCKSSWSNEPPSTRGVAANLAVKISSVEKFSFIKKYNCITRLLFTKYYICVNKQNQWTKSYQLWQFLLFLSATPTDA
jgi:hypothetical protein